MKIMHMYAVCMCTTFWFPFWTVALCQVASGEQWIGKQLLFQTLPSLVAEHGSTHSELILVIVSDTSHFYPQLCIPKPMEYTHFVYTLLCKYIIMADIALLYLSFHFLHQRTKEVHFVIEILKYKHGSFNVSETDKAAFVLWSNHKYWDLLNQVKEKERMERCNVIWSIEPGSKDWKSSALSVQGWQISRWRLEVWGDRTSCLEYWLGA